jgi:hypothetical protein
VIISALSSVSNFMPFDVSLSEGFMASQGTKHHLNSVREVHEINGTIMKCCYQPRHTQFILLPTAECISSFRQFVARAYEMKALRGDRVCVFAYFTQQKRKKKIKAFWGNRVYVCAYFAQNI